MYGCFFKTRQGYDFLLLLVLVLVVSSAAPLYAQEAALAKPKGHFKVEKPANLSDADALVVYDSILDEIVAGYGLSKMPAALRYRQWKRFNKVPYRSATHGERYVNNYANMIGESYGKFEESGTLPEGSILAKDSFAVTARGGVFTGPLFLMMKMAAGFNPESRDWRYVMIMPDGSLFGETKGEGSDRVEFCITCHLAAGDENDHLFFIPEEYRTKFFKIDLN